MTKMLPAMLCACFLLPSLAVPAQQEPAQVFMGLYRLMALEKQPLIHDLSQAFVEMSLEETPRDDDFRVYYSTDLPGYGPVFLEIGQEAIHGMKLELSGEHPTGHAAPKAHESQSAPAAHGGPSFGGSTFVVQPRPSP